MTPDPVVTTANPVPVQTQKTASEWFDTVMRAAGPVILAYIAAVGTPTSEQPKDQFTTVVSNAIADGEFDLARRLIDAVDPPDAKGGGK